MKEASSKVEFKQQTTESVKSQTLLQQISIATSLLSPLGYGQTTWPTLLIADRQMDSS